MKPDIPVIGGEPKRNSLLSPELFQLEWRRVMEHAKAFHARMNIQELRKSCGVQDSPKTVNVRTPPRYRL